MNIALFTDSYLPTKSGVVTVVNQLYESLKKLGHKVIIITVASETDEKDPNIYRVNCMPVGFGMRDQYLGFPILSKVIKFLKENKVEIVHVHTEFAMGSVGYRAAKILKIPAVCTTHTLWEDYYPYYIPMGKLIPVDFIRRIMRHFYRRFYALINVSTKAHNYFKLDYMTPIIPSVVIPNALNPEKYCITKSTKEEIEELRQKLGFTPDTVMLLFVGRIAEEKRVFELLEMCSQILLTEEKVKAVFVGDGPGLKYTQKLAQSYGIEEKITFTGFIDWFEVHKYYEAGDIFITASLSEMHSMTILEALNSGLPIVAREDSSYHDTVIPNVNGFLSTTDEQMEIDTLTLIKNKELRTKYSNNSLKIAKHYLPETFIQKHLVCYKTLIENYPNKLDEQELTKRVSSVTESYGETL